MLQHNEQNGNGQQAERGARQGLRSGEPAPATLRRGDPRGSTRGTGRGMNREAMQIIFSVLREAIGKVRTFVNYLGGCTPGLTL